MTIRGERVCLRAVEPEDIAAMMAHLRGHPEEMRTGGPGFLDFPESDAALRESLTTAHERAGRHDRGWSIVRLDDGVIVGSMATTGTPNSRNHEQDAHTSPKRCAVSMMKRCSSSDTYPSAPASAHRSARICRSCSGPECCLSESVHARAWASLAPSPGSLR
jgi:hypothetical protein